MHYLRYAMIACLAMVGFAAVPSASHAEWVLLGQQEVGFRVDRDVIRVGRHEGRFDAIKIRVLNNDIEMLDLKVIYGNGEPDNIPVRQFLRGGTETRSLELRGERGRRIDRIELTYRSRPDFRGRAVVQVYGDSVRGHGGGWGRDEGRRDDRRGDDRRDARDDRRDDRRDGRDDRRDDRRDARDDRRDDRRDGRDDRRERRTYDWELLGAKKVGVMVDRDVIDVGMREGRFRKIKLRARGNDINMFNLTVVYGNGQRDEIPVRERLREGTETRPLDLRGRDRFIRRIEMTYARNINFRGRATIEVWGLQGD